jgi:hypothetical protein
MEQSIDYILVDYENIQAIRISALNAKKFAVYIFVGKSQNRIPFDLVEHMQKFGSMAEWIKIEGNGPNALDFHIAFTLGVLATANPHAHFYIVSKDTGFDPLVNTLDKKGISCKRIKSVEELLPKPNHGKEGTLTDNPAYILDKIKNSPKPRSEKTLRNTIAALFNKQKSAEEVAAIIEEMKSRKLISINLNKIEYNY